MPTFKIIPLGAYADEHRQRAQSIADEHGLKLEIHDTTLHDPDLLKKAEGADILVTTFQISEDILPVLPDCRLIAIEGTGYNSIDVDKARQQGTTVCNVPDYSSDDVAERIFSFILGLSNHLFEGHATVLNDGWTQPAMQVAKPLKRRTLGLYGLGKIGQKVAHMGHAFGMTILAYTAHPDVDRMQRCRLRWAQFDELVERSDYLVLAAPATADNHEIFNADVFKKMKSSAHFINCARGALVDESALADALKKGEIAGAGVDVFQEEPIPKDHPLLTAPRTILSPHTALASEDSLRKLHDIALDNVAAFLEGKPQNVVN